jgi:hypothetical protein
MTRRDANTAFDAKLGQKVRKRIAAKGLNVSAASAAAGVDRTILTRAIGGTRPWQREWLTFDELVAGTKARTILAAAAETVPRAEYDYLRLEYLKAQDEIASLRRTLATTEAAAADLTNRHERHLRRVDSLIARILVGVGLGRLPRTSAALKKVSR